MGDILQKDPLRQNRCCWVDVWQSLGLWYFQVFATSNWHLWLHPRDFWAVKKNTGWFLVMLICLCPEIPTHLFCWWILQLFVGQIPFLLDTHPSRPFVGITSLTLSHPFNKHIGKPDGIFPRNPTDPPRPLCGRAGQRPTQPAMYDYSSTTKTW